MARRTELGEIVRLAVPLVIAYGGNLLISFVDVAMAGRAGPAALAGVGIGAGLFYAITCVAMGAVAGTETLVAQAIGAKEETNARYILAAGVRLAFWLAVPSALVVVVLASLLPLAGVESETAAASLVYVLGRAISSLPLLLFIAQRSYLQAKGITRPIVIAMVIENIVNFIGDALFIYGDGALETVGLPKIGMPALGAFGCGLASSIASMSAVIVLDLAVRRSSGGAIESAPPSKILSRMREIARIGLPFGMQALGDAGIFTLTGILVGRIGALAAAAHQVTFTLTMLTFNISIGLSSALAVRVGLHVGAGDTPAARRSGFLGLVLAIGVMAVPALIFLLVPGPVAHLLTSDPAVIKTAIPLIMIAGAFQLADGTQATAGGALRGAGDTRFPFYTTLAAYYGLGLPLSIVFAFTFGLGVAGVWWGGLVGLFFAAVLLVVRFARLSAKPIARV